MTYKTSAIRSKVNRRRVWQAQVKSTRTMIIFWSVLGGVHLALAILHFNMSLSQYGNVAFNTFFYGFSLLWLGVSLIFIVINVKKRRRLQASPVR